MKRSRLRGTIAGVAVALVVTPSRRRRAATAKPPLHGRHWVAITGKPLGATAGAMMFQKGGNAVDAACAMLAATSHDVGHAGLGRRDPGARSTTRKTKKVVGVNALGVAPTGATPEFFKAKGMALSARVRAAGRGHARHARRPHGDAGGVGQAVAWRTCWRRRSRWRTAIPIEAQLANGIERQKARIKEWPYSKAVFLPHLGRGARGAASRARSSGSPTSRPRCASWWRRSSRRWRRARRRKEAIQAAYDRFYKGDIAQELVRGTQEQGGLITLRGPGALEGRSIEEPVHDELQGHRRLQARPVDAGPGDAPGAEHPGERRPQGDGLQQRALHPHALPGDEPGLRRPRLLLRRPVLPARGAGAGAALEGVREAAARADRAGSGTIPTCGPGDPYPVPGRHATRSATLLEKWRTDRRAPKPQDAAGRSGRTTRTVPRGHHVDRGGRRGGLGGVGDAERRLDARR